MTAGVAAVRDTRRGRARDPSIDARALAVAARHLAAQGFDAMSVAAIAEEARTTRAAIYRRWPTKASLAAAALALAEEPGPGGAPRDTNPLVALTSELANFQRGVSRPGRLSLVGTMLQDGTDPDVRARYRAQVVAPRRSRIRRILEDARVDGWIDPDADIEIAVTLCTGSWYAAALARDRPPADWAARVAAIVWTAVGGETA